MTNGYAKDNSNNSNHGRWQQAKKDLDDVAGSSKSSAAEVAGFVKQILGIGSATAALAVLATLSDEYTEFENRVALATKSQSEQLGVMNSLVGVAENTGRSLNSVGEAYEKLKISTEGLGLSDGQVIGRTNTLEEAFIDIRIVRQQCNRSHRAIRSSAAQRSFTGRQFQSIIKSQPFLIDELSKSLGLASAQFRQLGRMEIYPRKQSRKLLQRLARTFTTNLKTTLSRRSAVNLGKSKPLSKRQSAKRCQARQRRVGSTT